MIREEVRNGDEETTKSAKLNSNCWDYWHLRKKCVCRKEFLGSLRMEQFGYE